MALELLRLGIINVDRFIRSSYEYPFKFIKLSSIETFLESRIVTECVKIKEGLLGLDITLPDRHYFVASCVFRTINGIKKKPWG